MKNNRGDIEGMLCEDSTWERISRDSHKLLNIEFSAVTLNFSENLLVPLKEMLNIASPSFWLRFSIFHTMARSLVFR